MNKEMYATQAMPMVESTIKQQIERIERLSTRLTQIPDQIENALSTVMRDGNTVKPPAGVNSSGESELAHILANIANRLESAEDKFSAILAKIDL